MKTARRFKDSWFYLAIVVAIIVAEVVAWEVANHFDLRTNPVVVGVLAVGIVSAIVAVLYEGVDIG